MDNEQPKFVDNLYIIEIVVSSTSYYTVQGVESLESKEDFFFSKGNKILLFTSLESLRIFVIKNKFLTFFKGNTWKRWVEGSSTMEPKRMLDLDFLAKELDGNLTEFDIQDAMNLKFLKGIFDLIEIAHDLKFQFCNEDLQLILESPAIDKLNDSLYDNFIWKTDDVIKTRHGLQEMIRESVVINELKELLNTVINNFMIIDV